MYFAFTDGTPRGSTFIEHFYRTFKLLLKFKEKILETTGKPIKWIICFSSLLSKLFLQKSLKNNNEICRKLKKNLGPAVYNPPRRTTPKTKI